MAPSRPEIEPEAPDSAPSVHPQRVRRSSPAAQPLRTPAQADRTAVERSRTEQSATPWAALEPEAVARELGTNLARGLEPDEAAYRLARDGVNELGEPPPRPALLRFLAQFADVTVIALIVAAVMAVVLGWDERRGESFLHRFGDAIAIGIIVLMNAVIGFVQERKADRALAALRQLGVPTAMVRRAGSLERIPSRDIVAGDVLEVREGVRVPADARLFETADLVVNESALTGESVPVDKLEVGVLEPDTPLAERANMVFMGTHVARGHGHAVCVTTGPRTELGRIAELLGEVETPTTPLQASLRRFGLRVVVGCSLLGLLVFAVGFVRLEASIGFLLLTAVSLAVAAIPEGLPAVTTIVMALGVERMAKKNALIRRLAAVETLGCADVICTDKTGTLTQNLMLVRRVYAGGESFTASRLHSGAYELRDDHGPRLPCFAPLDPVAELVVACGTAPGARFPDEGGSPEGDPTDAALLRLGAGYEVAMGEARSYVALRVLPFDRERRMATVVISGPNGPRSYTHGAPESVLARCASEFVEGAIEHPFDDARRGALERVVHEWAALGLRVIALSRAPATALDLESATLSERNVLAEKVEENMVLLGLLGLADPPREEARFALERARAAGVRTVMITGDHPLTARAIASELGIVDADGEVITGAEIDATDDAALCREVDRVRVVARASAENKLRLVQALRARGHVVAMTGDGVNDAPAIKAASIGVAMGRGGTDVTREAADMVLLDDNYATIVGAIEQGRIVYGNIKRFIVFLFTVNTGLVLAVLFGALAGWPPLLTPTEILWINLITNGLPALALGMEPVHLDPMTRPPRPRDEGLVTRSELYYLLGHGTFMALLGIATFAWLRPDSPDDAAGLAVARSATFTLLAIAPLFHALNARSRSRSLFALGLFSNSRLLGAFLAALLFQGLALYVPTLSGVFATTPLSPRLLGQVLGLSATVWLVGELDKWARNAVRKRARSPQ
jgi:P-type Ca2+ transporter type 2C